MKLFFNKLLNILNPEPKIAGLEINDAAAHLAFLKGNNVFSLSVDIPHGIVEKGQVRDKEGFKKILSEIKKQIPDKKNGYVILSISDVNVYTQVLSLPQVARSNLEEAVGLNLQTVSPTALKEVYADWQELKGDQNKAGMIEILAAFARRNVVDGLVESLRSVGLIPAAVEFPGLSLSRLTVKQPVIIIHATGTGLSFNLVKEGNLYFNYSIPWATNSLSLPEFQEIVNRETQKVLNFATGRWSKETFAAFIVSPNRAFEENLEEIIKKNFKAATLGLEDLASDELKRLKTENVAPKQLAALGSALRGLIPRGQDTVISLTDVGTEEEFRHQQLLNFIRIWRNVLTAILGFSILIFAGADLFFVQNEKVFETKLRNQSASQGSQEALVLEKEAVDFNKKAGMILAAYSETSDWLPIIERIQELAGKTIILDRIYIQSKEVPLVVIGRTLSEGSILNFKSSLNQYFENVDLPLSSIKETPGGFISFTVNFRLKR